MGDGKEHGESDRWGMEQRDDSGFSVGVPLGGGDVRVGYDHPLGADQLEATLSSMVQRHATLADGRRRVHGYPRHLSVRLRRDATVYIFSILKIDRFAERIKTVSLKDKRLK